jgi:hypothetical protein
MPFWITALAACVLAGSLLVVTAHVISHSYANVPDSNALPGPRAAPAVATDAQDESAISSKRIVSPFRNACTGCGVVRSVRTIPGVVDVPGPDQPDVRAAGAKGKARFEYTIRFRDGTETIFNESTPRNWRAGNRVIVIDGAHSAAH